MRVCVVCVCVCRYIYYNGDGRCYPSTPLGRKFKCRKMQIERTQCNMIIFLGEAGRGGGDVEVGVVELEEGHSFCF